MRIDLYLFEKQLARSRTRGASMVEDGIVYCNGKVIEKPSFEVPDGAAVEIRGETLPYVSRGGLKLEGALKSFAIDVNGMIAIDFGASTGGFTDCLLQKGCQKVYAIDSGTNQLDPVLRDNPAVISMENCNARYLWTEDIGELCDIAVCDLSFISQTLLHAVVASVLKLGGHFITLIKPQFEVGKANLGKKGIVKNEKHRMEALHRVVASAECVGFRKIDLIPSPILGGDGNTEYLAHFILER